MLIWHELNTGSGRAALARRLKLKTPGHEMNHCICFASREGFNSSGKFVFYNRVSGNACFRPVHAASVM